VFRAMAWKELREVRGVVLLAATIYLVLAMGSASKWDLSKLWNLSSTETNAAIEQEIDPGPFLTDGSADNFWWFAAVLAAGLGSWQTLGESVHGAWPFLLHRPAGRRWLMGMKMAVGLGLYLLGGAAVILALGIRSATPGVHPAPFFWWMTVRWWGVLSLMTVIYLTAFLIGIRSARWYGTRLLPLAAVPLFLWGVPESLLWRLLVVLLVDAALVRSILFSAQNRDYS
jgi:hypothetical protein